MINFEQFFSSLEKGVAGLAVQTAQGFENEAKQDGQAAVDSMKTNLTLWTQELTDGDMKPEDFRFLMLSQKDLMEMDSLKQAGLAAIDIDNFKDSLISLVISSVTALL